MVVVLVALSEFFSSSESAIFTSSIEEVRDRAGRGDRRASALAEMRDDPHRLLVTILVGNSVVNLAISSITTVVLVTYLPPGLAAVVATVVASALVLEFGEIVPKSCGLGNADSWALTVARPISLVETLLLPLVVVFDVVTRGLSEFLGGDREIEEQWQ